MPLLHPSIIELSGRTDQGMTKPYRCLADDGHRYYVKSEGAGWRSLVAEWVAGRLAVELGLPVPALVQVDVDPCLSDILRADGDRDLAPGLAFGSRMVEPVREFDPSLVQSCGPRFRQDLLAFDWWVHNADRTLGKLSGNPNLLWNLQNQQPVVIDHNMAFDPDFDANQFLQSHVFSADWLAIAGDMVMRAEYEHRFAGLLGHLDAIWGEVPHNWVFREDGSPRATKKEFQAQLARFESPGFWATP